ncbi:NADH dehydrogenase [Pustulibacterium marinum]|uniref:NADH:ubiquinone reductase (non-electrogenic) n=1 Tax=Pustulibacterium marinum TaxID=1224947 RepID=A0A1I7FRQ3_9FLAO|nr:NAD(P)/FAD-dependent oxidoreductase [Pustulibacterium marinum]SFU38821.1 NADH dehydrogenase [Pustulibacterium marinum]
MEKKHVVIIGGGFSGVNLLKKLRNNNQYEITLVDKNNYNFFPPLIYQVATGFLEPSSISYPFRRLTSKRKNTHFWLGEVEKIDTQNKQIHLNNGSLTYDILVLAAGTQTNYFGMENIEKHAIPMNTLEDALNMRNLLLQRVEKACKIQSIEKRREYLNIVIAGGGPTGVEVAGMFAELRKRIVKTEYPELVGTNSKVYIVNSPNCLLPPMSRKSQQYAENRLKNYGVEVLLKTRVSDFNGEEVFLNNGETIKTKNLIWATGVEGIVFEGIPAESYTKGKRLETNSFHEVKDLNDVYALGDASLCLGDENFPDGHPQLAQVAIQQAQNLAHNLKSKTKNKPLKKFQYKDKGSMAIIGKSRAVADIPKPKFHLQGFVALMVWAFIHLFSLISYTDRLRTFINWVISYTTQDQDLRMIIRPKKRL